MEVDTDGWRIGNWVNRQRTAYRLGQLSAERVTALEEVPGWAWRVQPGTWEDSLNCLKAFQQSKGRLPQLTEADADGVRIGNWVSTQRIAYNSGKLSAERTLAMEGVPGWAWRVHQGPKTSWEDSLDCLKAFEQSNGRLPRLTEAGADGVRIGNWVNHQRTAYRLGKLSAERILAIEGVPGWAWRVQPGPKTSWEDRLDCLKTFQHSNGRLPQQIEADADGRRLGNWVNTQQRAYHSGKLSSERITALAEVPGWAWRVPRGLGSDDWVDMARAFQQANGHLPQQGDTWDGRNVGTWVFNKRVAYHKGGLSQEMIAACEAIPGWVWKVKYRRSGKIAFDLGLSALKAFVQAHGRLPQACEVGGKPLELHLGQWIPECRRRKRQGKLTPDQIAALEGVPGWWWEKAPKALQPMVS